MYKMAVPMWRADATVETSRSMVEVLMGACFKKKMMDAELQVHFQHSSTKILTKIKPTDGGHQRVSSKMI